MSDVDSQIAAARRISRKSHRKSRNGCANCKKRRIKCNEQRPQCANCLKHSDQCSYANPPPSQPSPVSSTGHEQIHPELLSQSNTHTPRSINEHTSNTPFLGAPQPPQILNVTDLELLHNYHTSTSYTLSNIPALQNFLRVVVPRMGFSHPYVLHGIMAVSALHTEHFKSGQARDHYHSLAEHHHTTGLRLATMFLQNITDDNCPALYVFGTFCHMYTLGMGPKKGDFLIFSDIGLAEWLVLFRGVDSMVESNYELLMNSELAPLFQISINLVRQPSGNNEHLKELTEAISALEADNPDLPLYLESITQLSQSFPASAVPGIRPTQASPQIVFMWLFRLRDEFITRLQQRKPVALVILAHFCVLLNDLSSFWWISGWTQHLLSEIHGCLDQRYRMMIQWPMEEIGWIPN